MYNLPYIDELYIQPESEPTITESEWENIDAFCGNRDLLAALNNRIKLSRNERLVMAAILNEAQEPLKLKDIAKIVGISPQAVRKIKLRVIKKARAALKEMLKA